ncbi:hypothetical protein [Janthinobacterium sp.]|uniref:hypothetical protein n=1 Tax=Janthinobacterium sp. TaxID=1871054 RepID=UPI00293D4EA3|nr:hypothetical protein [Janthinobacterium sp.]
MSVILSPAQLSAVLALEVFAADVRHMGLPTKAEFQVLEAVKEHVQRAKEETAFDEPPLTGKTDQNKPEPKMQCEIQAAHLTHLEKLKADWK